MAEIILDKINYTYSDGTAYEIQALKDVNLQIHQGEFIGIIGHTGSGKSTLTQLLNGLLRASSGSIYVDGQDIYDEGYDMKALRSKVGVVFQYPDHQLFETTCFEDVCFGPKNQGLDRRDVELRAFEALRNVGFPEELFYQPPFDLSGGQKRRVAIAGVLAMKPDVLILDEPTNHLDMRSKDVLKEAVKEFDGTVIVVSHDREFLDGLVTKVYEFGGGLVKEHIGGIYDFLQKKKMENLNELQLSQSPQTASPKKEEPAESESKLSYEAQKELNKKIRKLEKQVADCEAKIEKLEEQVAQLEEQMATPEGASDMKLYEQHQQLKKQIAEAEEEWTLLLSELEEMK